MLFKSHKQVNFNFIYFFLASSPDTNKLANLTAYPYFGFLHKVLSNFFHHLFDYFGLKLQLEKIRESSIY